MMSCTIDEFQDLYKCLVLVTSLIIKKYLVLVTSLIIKIEVYKSVPKVCCYIYIYS